MSDQLERTPYPWYETVEGDELEQGDFIDDYKIFIPSYTLADLIEETTGPIKYNTEIHNIVVINQTCDLRTKVPLPNVVVCPRWSYKQVRERSPNFSSKTTFEEVRKGKQYRFFMLNRCDLPGLVCDIQIVDLAQVYFISFDILKQFAQFKGERIRLRSPYKEKLAQAFAYYYMRVASPIDIAEYDIVNSAQISSKREY